MEKVANDKNNNKEDSATNIKVAFFLNLGFTIIEIIGGFWTNSIAIISDALHDLGDSLSLGLSWFLERYSRKKKDEKYSYGYRRYSLFAALINGLILIIGSVFILFEAIPRLFNPQQLNAKGMLFFAVAGIIINGIAALQVRKGKSLNERIVSLHLFEDVLGWAAVLIISIVMIFKNIPVLDPILSILITIYILYRVIINLKKTFSIFLQAVPEGISIREIEDKLLKIDGVVNVHHTHVWSMDSLNNVLSVHIVVKDNTSVDEIAEIKRKVREIISSMNPIHSTIEIEYEHEFCELRDNECF
ncbi:MAG: cation diffusion facilitator family transporter [Candidatus Humimicrobiaceae bacterium]|jgi:cobalt-zinc-cadmium efflux system protein|nr:cation diffusion facilitator family transporter [Candidatus Humimicrobiaceae bacterium]